MSLVVGIRFFFPDSSMFLCGIKENGFPRRFAQRDGGIPRFIDLPPSPFRGNDRLVLDMCVDLYVSARCSIAGRHSGRPLRVRFWCTLSFLSCSCRYSGDPFGADAPLPLRGAALRGKDSGFCADLGSASRQRFRTGAWRRGAPLAPLLGELSRRRLRGRQGGESAIREKTRLGKHPHTQSKPVLCVAKDGLLIHTLFCYSSFFSGSSEGSGSDFSAFSVFSSAFSACSAFSSA